MLAAGGCSRPATDSAVLIVVDTLRADHLGIYGYRRPTSPRLDEWAQRGVVFEHAFSTSPWTLPAFGSLFTGRLPSRHLAGTFTRDDPETAPQKKNFRKLESSLPTLAEEMKRHGLATGAVISNAFLGPRFGVSRGFDTYDYHPSHQRRSRRGDAAVDLALDWLDRQAGKPFFLTLHLFDPHLGYDPPPPFRGRFSGDVPETGKPRVTDLMEIRPLLRSGEGVDIDYLEALYDEEVLFVDFLLGRFLDELERRAILDRAVVVLTSDHGEEFLEHEDFEHGHSVYNELLRVPLILWGPQLEPGRSDAPASLIDLYPTLLEAVGTGGPGGSPGRSLLTARAGKDRSSPRLLLAESTLYGPERRAAVRWPYKLTQKPWTDEVALFDLSTDFSETRDLAGERPEIARRLTAALRAVLDDVEVDAAAEEAELDPETLESLRSLGYIQ
jgi:choline-sulfatase